MSASMSRKPLWNGGDVARALNVENPAYWPSKLAIKGVSIDSRSLKAGDLFIALKGKHHDGHDYIATVRKADAAGVIISDKVKPPVQLPYLQVRDTYGALVALGLAARARSTAHIFAITGSAGKTSTKEMLRLVLSASSSTYAAAQSYNNAIGVPLSLARLPQDCGYGVFELGMNHAGEIERLVSFVRPHTAIITNIAEAHIGNFVDIAAIAAAKAEIFTGLLPLGTVILPRDSGFYAKLAKAARGSGAGRVLGFGRHRQAFARLLNQTLYAEYSLATAEINDFSIIYRIGVGGGHHVMNSLAVLAAVSSVEADIHMGALALNQMHALDGRGMVHKLKRADGVLTLIDESYNANPLSMAAALASLAQMPHTGARRIAILGDMAELGDEAGAYHAALGETIKAYKIDKVYCCGRYMRHLARVLPKEMRGKQFSSAAGFVAEMDRHIAGGDVVMVKGSFASGMGKIVDALRNQPKRSVAKASKAGGKR